jgi:hypothetical protein
MTRSYSALSTAARAVLAVEATSTMCASPDRRIVLDE